MRGELPGVAILRRPDAFGDEGPLHAGGTTEGLTRCGVDRRPGHRSRRQPRGAVVVLIGAHVILFRALGKRTRAMDSSTAPRTGLAKLVSTLPRLWAVAPATVGESMAHRRRPTAFRRWASSAPRAGRV